MYKRIFYLLVLCCLIGQSAYAQLAECKGIVRSAENGQPITGALVVVVGTAQGCITDADGQFVIHNIKSKNSKLSVSFLGYQTQEITPKAFNNLTLKLDNLMLGEVVVVAYGKSSKAALTGSVAQVNAEAMQKRTFTSPLAALEGAAAGVQVNNLSGDINQSNFDIRIRGIGSVNGNNAPIIVVDGMIYEGNINDINPSDIANISVLKDASSTALYGNKGANGVVLITTKGGSSQRLSVELDVKQGTYNRAMGHYEKMGVKDWMESYFDATKMSYMIDGAKLNEADATAKTRQELVGLIGLNIFDKQAGEVFDADGNMVANVLPGYTDTDWMKAIERHGYRQEYNLNANAATEKYDFFASVGYMNQQGYIKSSDMNRTSARVKANFRPNDWLKAGVNLAGNISEGNYLNFDPDNVSAVRNPFVTLERMAPVYPYYTHNEDGSLATVNGKPTYNLGQSYLNNRNLIYELENNENKMKRSTLSGDVYATASFLNDFQFTVRGNLYTYSRNSRMYQNKVSGEAIGVGILNRNFYDFKQYRFAEELNWAHQFDKHHVELFLAHEAYKLSIDRDVIQMSGQNMDVVAPEISNFASYSQSSGYQNEYTTEGYLARGRYNYANTYFIEASFRRDGSSRFYNPWGNFWSVGANWLISNERLMKPYTFVNSLKLRASYGETGNDEISGIAADYYPYQGLYTSGTYAGYGAYTVGQNLNQALTWEKNATFDIALEARLFNRLNLTVEYYDRKSKDLLFKVYNPLSAGATDIYYYTGSTGQSLLNKNVGNLSNRGWEIAADMDVIRCNDWTWNIGLNLTLPTNKITKLPNGEDIENGSIRFSEGHSVNEFYTYQWAGTDQANGRGVYLADPELATEDNLAKGNIFKLDNGEFYTYNTTYGRRDWSGSALPDCYGSIGTSLTYKDFTLSLLGTWSLGGKVYDTNYAFLMELPNGSYGALHTDLLKAWKEAPAGMTESYTGADRISAGGIPRMDASGEGALYSSQQSTPASSRFLTDASFFMMKNISLQYRLPDEWVKACNLQGISLSAGVENAFYFTARKGLNPQYSYSGSTGMTYSPSRVFTLAANVKF